LLHLASSIDGQGVKIEDELHQSRPIKIGDPVFDVTPGRFGLLAFLGFIGHGAEIVTTIID
jgi:hypothetical protein